MNHWREGRHYSAKNINRWNPTGSNKAQARIQLIFGLVMLILITFSIAMWIWAGFEVYSMKGSGHELKAQMTVSFAILSSLPIFLLMITKG